MRGSTWRQVEDLSGQLRLWLALEGNAQVATVLLHPPASMRDLNMGTCIEVVRHPSCPWYMGEGALYGGSVEPPEFAASASRVSGRMGYFAGARACRLPGFPNPQPCLVLIAYAYKPKREVSWAIRLYDIVGLARTELR